MSWSFGFTARDKDHAISLVEAERERIARSGQIGRPPAAILDLVTAGITALKGDDGLRAIVVSGNGHQASGSDYELTSGTYEVKPIRCFPAS